MVAAVPIPLPTLTEADRALLDAFCAPGAAIHTIAAAHNLPASQLLDWTLRPDIAPRLQALDDLRTRLLRTDARATAAHTLTTLARTSEDPIERRRAAVALLRLISPTPASSSSSSPSPPSPPPVGPVSDRSSPFPSPVGPVSDRSSSSPPPVGPVSDWSSSSPPPSSPSSTPPPSCCSPQPTPAAKPSPPAAKPPTPQPSPPSSTPTSPPPPRPPSPPRRPQDALPPPIADPETFLCDALEPLANPDYPIPDNGINAVAQRFEHPNPAGLAHDLRHSALAPLHTFDFVTPFKTSAIAIEPEPDSPERETCVTHFGVTSARRGNYGLTCKHHFAATLTRRAPGFPWRIVRIVPADSS